MKAFSILLSILLLTSLFAILGNNAGAQEPDLGSVQTSGRAYSDEVGTASGSNRFVVWFDQTPGNSEILFRRSTDNGATWLPTKNLSNNPGSSLWPEIAVQGSNVYVTWDQYSGTGNLHSVFLRASPDNGVTWGPKINLSGSIANTDSPAPRIAASGDSVYVTWYDIGNGGSLDVFFKGSTNKGTTWGAIINMSHNAGDSYYPEIAASGSNVYLVWNDYTPGERDILLSRSADSGATWGIKNLSNDNIDSWGPQIAVSGNNVHVAWSAPSTQDSEKYDVLARRSTDGGATWKSIVNISGSGPASGGLDLIVASGANVYVFWNEGTYVAADLMLRRSTDNGATWAPEKRLVNDASSWVYLSVAATGNKVYIAWGDAEISFMRSLDSGVTWSTTTTINSSTGPVGIVIAATGSNVFIGWHGERGNFGKHDIYLTRSVDNGATWKAEKNLSWNYGQSWGIDVGI